MHSATAYPDPSLALALAECDDALMRYQDPKIERAWIYLPGFGLHSLRLLSITWRQECGAALVEAMRQAGHSKPAMTAHYTLDGLRREMRVVERLRERLRGVEEMGQNGTQL